MSREGESRQAVTVSVIQKRKQEGKPISMVTCYDSAFGRIIDASPVDMVLVGDSLGNVMLGYDSTIPVTMEHMIHHTAAVTRVVRRPFVAADMPFMSYSSRELALKNAGDLIQKGGAQAVKLEGGESVADHIEVITGHGIPVIGHLGLTPQSIHALGGYRVQARESAQRKQLLADAKALEDAGAFCVVLELIPSDLAREVTSQLSIPTIGIGAGVGCDGQVLVLHDLLGMDQSFNPKFLKKYANLGKIIGDALDSYDRDVKSRVFPSAEQGF